MSKIVSIQDISCFGQCSLTVALPVISSYGIETAILPSGILSTHTGGFTNYTYHDLTDEMPKIVNHWISEGIIFDAIYTGYIGDVRQFDLIKSCKKTILKEGGLLIADPAMADFGKLYSALSQDIVAGMKDMISVADIILPNLTEAAFLLDEEYSPSCTKEGVQETLKKLTALGPKIAILTGVNYLEDNKIGAVAYNKETGEFTEYFTEKIPKSFHGTGDVFSSVAVAMLVNGATLYDTLREACEFTLKSIKNTLGDEAHTYGVKFESVLK